MASEATSLPPEGNVFHCCGIFTKSIMSRLEKVQHSQMPPVGTHAKKAEIF